MVDPGEIPALAIPIAVVGLAYSAIVRIREIRLLGVAVALLGLLVLSLESCAISCTVRGTPFVSPNGDYVARTFAVDGGATESFHGFVKLRPKYSIFSRLVFQSDYDPGAIQIGWLGPRHLLIRYPQDTVADRFQCIGGADVQATCEPLDNGPAARPVTDTAPPKNCSCVFR